MKERKRVARKMNSVFSSDDFSESFWSSPSPPLPPVPATVHGLPMNWSQSEWALEKFFEEVSGSPGSVSASSVAVLSGVSQSSASRAKEGGDDDVVEIKKPHHDRPLDSRPTAPVSHDEYRAILKNKLDLACAVAAMRGSSVKPENKSSITEKQTQLGSRAPVLPDMQRKSGGQAKQATSGSSREDSDDEELEGDMEATEGLDRSDDKRARRMLSNRESARRSRRRKQAHLSEMETQAGQLRVEHSSLLKGLTAMNHKYDEAAVNNRILKADIETLRAKVKMAEETVKRVTGFNPLVLGIPNVPNVGMPFVSSSMDLSTNPAVALQPNPNQFFHQPVPSIATAAQNHYGLDCGIASTNTQVPDVGNIRSDRGGSNITETSTLQHAVNRDHVHQQMGHRVNPSGAMPGWHSGLPHPGAENNK